MSDNFLNKKMKYVKAYIIFGVILIATNFGLSFLNVGIGDFWSIMLTTWGAVFIVMGIARFLLYRNKSVLKFYKIAETDERNELLRGKAGYLTFVFSIIALAICSVIFVSMDLTIPALVTLILLLVQYALFSILVWYYSKKL